MGKAEIISGGTGGLYTIKLIFERDFIAEKIADLTEKITAYETEIAGMPEGAAKTMAIFKKNALVKSREFYENNMPEDHTMEAWCADFTENLSGTVGTIEVPGERGYVNIQPGYGGNAVYNASRDGQLQPAIASRSASAVFYNLAMLPAWQKWQPTYRYGTIKSITPGFVDVCSVELDDIKSSHESLDINYLKIIDNVIMEYMGESHPFAYNIGDHVIVKFKSDREKTTENWENSLVGGIVTDPIISVIGFVDHPVDFTFHFKLTREDGTLITEAGGLFQGFTIYDSQSSTQTISSASYNSGTGYWSVTITGSFDVYDRDGYWVRYRCTYGIQTQFPNRYKSADLEQDADLIHPGYYEDSIPYWRVTTAVSGSIEAIGGVHQITKTVYASIPYKFDHILVGSANRTPNIRYKLNSFYPYGLTDAGSRCCGHLGVTYYIADINPIDSRITQIVLYNTPGKIMLPGGWADSYISFTIHSDKIDFIETYPAVAEVNITETEYGTANISGNIHIMKCTNTTVEHASREMICGGAPPEECTESGGYIDYEDAKKGDLVYSLDNFDYDF